MTPLSFCGVFFLAHRQDGLTAISESAHQGFVHVVQELLKHPDTRINLRDKVRNLLGSFVSRVTEECDWFENVAVRQKQLKSLLPEAW